MTWLSTGELTWMRSMQDEWLPDTAVIERRSDASDGMGGFTETWAAVGTANARLRPMSADAREYVTGEQMTSVAEWDITYEHGTDVRADDRTKINGRVFEIRNVNNDETWQTAVRAEAVSYNQEAERE